MRSSLLPALLAASALATPALADQHSLVQVICEPAARYFSIETILVDGAELPLGTLSEGNGLRTLRSLQDAPATCQVGNRQVEARVLRVYEPSEHGAAVGIESGLIAVAVDGRQVAELNRTHRASPAPRGRVTVQAYGVDRCGTADARLVGMPNDGHVIIVEDCNEKLFSELGLARR